jgi:hypothetical protein
MGNFTQFDLEQAIIRLWSMDEDIGLLYENVMEKNPPTDDIANALLGLKSLMQMRGEKCFELFESFIREYYELKKQNEYLLSSQKP